MAVTSLGWARRALSGVVCLAGLALVLAKTHGADTPETEHVAWVAAGCFILSLLALIEVARRENAEAERAAAERERRQLELLRLQFMRKKPAGTPDGAASPRPGPGAKLDARRRGAVEDEH
jgi:hypothetical protein